MDVEYRRGPVSLCVGKVDLVGLSTTELDIYRLIHRKKVLVLAGAGISVSCGIPDFRSKDKGLYSTLDFQVRNLYTYI